VAWAFGAVALGASSLLIPLYVVTIGGSTLMLEVGTAAAAGAPGALLFGRLVDRGGSRRALVLVGTALWQSSGDVARREPECGPLRPQSSRS